MPISFFLGFLRGVHTRDVRSRTTVVRIWTELKLFDFFDLGFSGKIHKGGLDVRFYRKDTYCLNFPKENQPPHS